ncbi:hypothetical protein L873DRAFT_270027 [Choiromyces venosus 120613-1]|uniref:Uncharacterized protein n=1 Tax=Choiromyces venosus 120613-1 TaxID=1336337 RepID=A0A3N4J3L6_9PEZI|nr:hypothetical protein L873DRAFT_270027 [Choiromyces venosus 120613-1]
MSCSWWQFGSEVFAKSSTCFLNFFTFHSASEICSIRWCSSCNNTTPFFQCFDLWHSNISSLQPPTAPLFETQKNLQFLHGQSMLSYRFSIWQSSFSISSP